VASLPEEHRLVVELRFFAGATLDEIARHGSPRFDQGLLGKIFSPVAILAKSERAAPQACGVLSTSRSKAIASPAWARSINSLSSYAGVFTVPMIPLLPPKGSLARTFSCEFPANARLNGG